MATSKELAANIATLSAELNTELDIWVTKGRKVAAKRARKLTLQLAGMYKDFRHASVEEAKTSVDDSGE